MNTHSINTLNAMVTNRLPGSSQTGTSGASIKIHRDGHPGLARLGMRTLAMGDNDLAGIPSQFRPDPSKAVNANGMRRLPLSQDSILTTVHLRAPKLKNPQKMRTLPIPMRVEWDDFSEQT